MKTPELIKMLLSENKSLSEKVKDLKDEVEHLNEVLESEGVF